MCTPPATRTRLPSRGAGLGGQRLAQPLHEEGRAQDGRPAGPEDPGHGQAAVPRHDACDGRQRGVDGPPRRVQRAADRRRRRCREQPTDAVHLEPVHGRHQVRHADAPPDHCGDLRHVQGHLGQADAGRAGAGEEVRARGPARAARSLGQGRGRLQPQADRRRAGGPSTGHGVADRRAVDRSGARWRDDPDRQRREQVFAARHPLFRACRSNHGRRRHGAAAGGPCRCLRRLPAWRVVAGEDPGLDLLRRATRWRWPTSPKARRCSATAWPSATRPRGQAARHRRRHEDDRAGGLGAVAPAARHRERQAAAPGPSSTACTTRRCGSTRRRWPRPTCPAPPRPRRLSPPRRRHPGSAATPASARRRVRRRAGRRSGCSGRRCPRRRSRRGT